MSRRDWILLIALAAIWGSSYLLIKIGIRDLSPALIVFARIALGAAVLVPAAIRSGALRNLGGNWTVLWIVAVAQIVAPFLLIALGEQQISSSLAGILVASAPIFTAILAIFFMREERSEGARLVGVLAGVAGVTLLLGIDLGGSSNELLGGLAVVGAGLGYAIGGLLVKQRIAGIEPLGIAAIVMVLATVLSAPAALASLPEQAPGVGPVAAVVVLGVLCTGLAFAIFYELIASVGPARTYLVTYLAPVFAVVYGVTLLDEGFGLATLLGLLMILAGSYLAAEGRLPGGRRRAARRSRSGPEGAIVDGPSDSD